MASERLGSSAFFASTIKALVGHSRASMTEGYIHMRKA
jgi:hypothetical protein